MIPRGDRERGFSDFPQKPPRPECVLPVTSCDPRQSLQLTSFDRSHQQPPGFAAHSADPRKADSVAQKQHAKLAWDNCRRSHALGLRARTSDGGGLTHSAGKSTIKHSFIVLTFQQGLKVFSWVAQTPHAKLACT
jgi:hypothetical protein